MQKPGLRSILMITVFLAVVSPVSGWAAIINATDSGWWSSGGFHSSDIKNYFVGGGGPLDDHNYFVFDLSGVSGTVVSATLRLENPSGGYGSPDPAETYTIFDVTTPVATLSASGSGAAAIDIYSDLGSGMILGSSVVSATSNGSIVQVTFSAAGLAYLQGASGRLVAIGGALTSLDTNLNTVEFLFGGTDASNVRQLDIQTTPVTQPVPEPATALMILSGFIVSNCRRIRFVPRAARRRSLWRPTRRSG